MAAGREEGREKGEASGADVSSGELNTRSSGEDAVICVGRTQTSQRPLSSAASPQRRGAGLYFEAPQRSKGAT